MAVLANVHRIRGFMPLCCPYKAWSAVLLFACDATVIGVLVEHKDLEASFVASSGYPPEDGVIGEEMVIEMLVKVSQ